MNNISFQKAKSIIEEDKKEALVMLGAGGEIKDWVDGVAGSLIKESIAPEGFKFNEWYTLHTTGGRIDLVLVLTEDIDIGKLAMWRLRFGDCSWLSDYIDNYRSQHN